MPNEDFFLTNLELRESNEQGDAAAGLSHDSMKGMTLLSVLELAARGVPRGAVTIIHDAGDAGDRYRDLAEALAADAWAVALPDLRGHGRSEGERGHSAGLREVERDLGEILDHLAYRMPDAPKVLVGVGLGALYAAHFALARPGILAGLALVNPLTSLPFKAPEKPKGLSKFFKKVTGESIGSGTGYTGALLSNDAEVASAWDANLLTHDQITLRAIEEAGRALGDSMCRLGELQCPTLVLRGGWFCGQGRYSRRRIPRSPRSGGGESSPVPRAAMRGGEMEPWPSGLTACFRLRIEGLAQAHPLFQNHHGRPGIRPVADLLAAVARIIESHFRFLGGEVLVPQDPPRAAEIELGVWAQRRESPVTVRCLPPSPCRGSPIKITPQLAILGKGIDGAEQGIAFPRPVPSF